MKFAGKVTVPWVRLMVTTRSPRGWRSTASVACPNSGSSSRNRTPRWLRPISPGRYLFARGPFGSRLNTLTAFSTRIFCRSAGESLAMDRSM